MTADIVQFPKPQANGAREALVATIEQYDVFHDIEADILADILIGDLYIRGFVVQPLDDDKPYQPNENTVRISVEDWRRINHSDPPE